MELLERPAQLQRWTVLAIRHHRDRAEVLAIDLPTENPFSERPLSVARKSKSMAPKNKATLCPAIIELSEPAWPPRRLPYRRLSQ
jgi:hypothetical protein